MNTSYALMLFAENNIKSFTCSAYIHIKKNKNKQKKQLQRRKKKMEGKIKNKWKKKEMLVGAFLT